MMATKKMRNGTTPRRNTFHCQRWNDWATTIDRVDNEPVMSATMTTVMPSAAS